MAVPLTLPIDGCTVVPAKGNPDARGCLYEIFRESWPGAFKAVQWNACTSSAGVVRGVHVHPDYDEFYTLLRGRARVGLHDIRSHSPTRGRSVTVEWSHDDGSAIVIPRGVAHLLYFEEDAILAFGLSGYWHAESDLIGCEWDDPALGFDMPSAGMRSVRDSASGTYAQMLADYESAMAAEAG